MTTEELQSYFNDLIARAERGELTKGDMARAIVAIGPEVDRICREFGDTSDRCRNMKTAIEQLQVMAMQLPDSTPSTYGIGTVAVAGILGMGVGALIFWASSR